ncbi:MAG: hypothetical protein ACI4HZ_03580 [Ruminococcus sp.]
MKKTLSIILALVIAISCMAVAGTTTAFAETTTENITAIPTYKTTSAFTQDVNMGKATLQATTTANEWSKTYSFTVSDDAYVLISYAYGKLADYSWNHDAYFDIYRDVLCTNKLDVQTSVNNDRAFFAKVAKGTYFIKTSTNFDEEDTFYLFLGKMSKYTKFSSLKYVKTNANRTVTYQLNTIDECQSVKAHKTNYGFTGGFTTRVCGNPVTLNSKKQFNITYTDVDLTSRDRNSYLSVNYYDVNGFEFDAYGLCLNKYTAFVAGVKNKTYTGKAVRQSGLTVKAGYDPASYTLSYKNNTKVGTATMTITGKGQTIGSVTKTFRINPASIAKASASVKGKTATIKWTKSKGAKTYVVQKKVGKTWKTVKKTTGTSYKTSVPKGKTYFRVYGTATVNKVAYNSAVKSVTVNRKK